MTLMPADVLMWTGISVSIIQLEAFLPAAEATLNADGGSAITGNSRNQLLSYLIAGYQEVANGNVGKQSESIGNYSYTRQSSSGPDIWTDLYKNKLASLITSAGQVTSTGNNSPIVDRIDKDMFRMNRQFPRPPGRLI